MKKLLLMAVAFGAMVASADSYLYWMIGDTETYYKDQVSYAKVKASKGDDSHYLTIAYSDGSSIGESVTYSEAKGEQSAGFGLYAMLGTYLAGYTYAVELYNSSDDEAIAQSYGLAYSQVGNYLVDSGVGVPGGSAWTAAYPVPEPTSGMMMLIGMAALALRRRRA